MPPAATFEELVATSQSLVLDRQRNRVLEVFQCVMKDIFDAAYRSAMCEYIAFISFPVSDSFLTVHGFPRLPFVL